MCAEPCTESFESVALENVTHRYFGEAQGGAFTLGPINLSFSRGEITFLIGGNGSGKTTLAKLLVGLYAPESGRILLNGQPVDEAQRDAYRQYFSVVFNDRSEERRVGKEGVSKCRSRWSPEH